MSKSPYLKKMLEMSSINIQSWTKVSGQPRKNSITVGKKKDNRFIEK